MSMTSLAIARVNGERHAGGDSEDRLPSRPDHVLKYFASGW